MDYLLYSLSFFSLLFIGTYLTRPYWISLLPTTISSRIPFIYTPLPDGGSFSDDAAAGLHSSDFDLTGNIESGDSRGGLDPRAKAAIQQIMKQRGLGFDEARRVLVQERFRLNGIGPDGRPRDPKFVSFS